MRSDSKIYRHDHELNPAQLRWFNDKYDHNRNKTIIELKLLIEITKKILEDLKDHDDILEKKKYITWLSLVIKEKETNQIIGKMKTL